MSGPAIHITLVTLGVTDVARAAAFYEALGLKRSSSSNDSVAFFDMGGVALGLFGWDALAQDANVPAQGTGFRGASLAWNQSSEAAVDAAIARAVEAGGQLVKPAHKVFWGGYSGYFADPDGHLWEAAYNPAWPLRANGAMELPPSDAKVEPSAHNWAEMDRQSRIAMSALTASAIPLGPGVYALYEHGNRVYVGKAASLRQRIWNNHARKGASMTNSALRRNVAQHIGIGAAADIKAGRYKPTASDADRVGVWLSVCEVAWLVCDSEDEALALEAILKSEHKPLLTRI